MRHHLLTCFLAFLLSFTALAQSTYGPLDSRDAWLAGGGAGLLSGSILLTQKVAPFEPEDIRSLQDRREGIWGVDRWVSRQWSVPAARVSDRFLQSSILLPLGLLIDNDSRDNFGRHAIIALEGLLLNTALTQLTKVTARRPRPFVYNPDVPLPRKLERDARFSFFSGHTSTVASLSFISARMYTDITPGQKNDPLVWATASAIPAVTGYLRIRAGKHFLTDVIVGYAVGAAIGLVVPRLHR